MEDILDPEKPLEAPDLDPVVVFDLPTLTILAGISLFVVLAFRPLLGTTLTLIAFFAVFYGVYRLYKYVKKRFPPGFWEDLFSWVGTKEVYYPGKPEETKPLVRD